MNELHSTDFLGVLETGSPLVKGNRDVLPLLSQQFQKNKHGEGQELTNQNIRHCCQICTQSLFRESLQENNKFELKTWDYSSPNECSLFSHRSITWWDN